MILKAENIKHVVATSARAKIPQRRPDEKCLYPDVVLLKVGWLLIMKNEITAIISLQTPKDVLKEARL